MVNNWDGKQLRYTRQNANIINNKDNTYIACSIKPTCDSFRNCFFYRCMILWKSWPYELRQVAKLSISKSKLTKLLWYSDTDWPDWNDNCSAFCEARDEHTMLTRTWQNKDKKIDKFKILLILLSMRLLLPSPIVNYENTHIPYQYAPIHDIFDIGAIGPQ